MYAYRFAKHWEHPSTKSRQSMNRDDLLEENKLQVCKTSCLAADKQDETLLKCSAKSCLSTELLPFSFILQELT